MKSCRTPQPIFLCILPENRSMTCSQLGDFLYSMEGPSRRPFLPLVVVAAVVQLLSYVWLFATPWTTAFQVSLSSLPPGVCSDSCPLSWWCHPTISSSIIPLLPSIFLSIRVFSNESILRIRCPKYCSFSFSISPSSEYSGLISLRIDWFSEDP